MNKYKLVVLCGKSGAGKNYLLQKIEEHYGNIINIIVPDTTRPPREGEEEGKEYHFLTYDQFFSIPHFEKNAYWINDYTCWFYGTCEASLDINKINIGIFSPGSIEQLYEKDMFDIYLFYISADDKTRLLRLLNREKYPNCMEICRRFLADEEDFKNLYKYPFKKIRHSSGLANDQCAAVLIEEIDQIISDLDRIE